MKINSCGHDLELGHARGKFKCPKCGHKRFVLWTLEGEVISDTIGMCDRGETCGHKYTMENYASSIGKKVYELVGLPLMPRESKFEVKVEVIPPSLIPPEMVIPTITAWNRLGRGHNNLYKFFMPIMLENGKNIEVFDALDSYPMGTGKVGEAIYWLKDLKGDYRSGKIIQYLNGSRVKDGKPARWVHTEMKLENFNLEQVFWGINRVNTSDVVVIVESEKSAYLMTAALYLDEANRNELIGMCCGGANYDYRRIKFVASGSSNGVAYKLEHKSITKNKDLVGCTVYLLPDYFPKTEKRDPYDTHLNWKDAADLMVKFSAIDAECVPIREEIAQKYSLEKGDDIWDLYLKMDGCIAIQKNENQNLKNEI